ncbi:lactonase family protein [Desertivirga arenae]|uniref:lactonase family protein n=1 Tax=Desertivirga arenae TaxID=2810309 RepID=UPI001F61BBBE|nr:lactonase family protein [Pedobacter sp. SYSU D00823]
MTLIKSEAQTLNLLIGTYTKGTKSEGIYVYEFDGKTGKATYKNKAAGLTNPSYLAVTKDGKRVYAVCEAEPGKGAVAALSFDKKSGNLNLLNTKPSIGNGPCYVSTDKDNKHVFLANYGGGSATAIGVNKDGSLNDKSQFIQYKGSSANKDRQEAPHVHSTVISPDNKFLMVSDLGTDKINIFEISKEEENPLKELTAVNTQPGSGPRHFDFHPNGKFGYSIQELSGNISAYAYTSGKLALIQDVSGLPENYNGKIWAADIHVSPDGKFLYASYRDDINDLAIFNIDSKTGKLTLAGRQSTMGRAPRNFVISPDGEFVLAANQLSDSVVIFKRDKETGLLKDTGERITVATPVCLKFVNN